MNYVNNQQLGKNTSDDLVLQRKKKKQLSSLSNCIESLRVEWLKEKSIAALWKDWPKVAGKQLSSNCVPLDFQGGVLTIGSNHPQWIQALIFNRNQLLAALRAQGHEIRDIRIQKHYPKKNELLLCELSLVDIL